MCVVPPKTYGNPHAATLQTDPPLSLRSVVQDLVGQRPKTAGDRREVADKEKQDLTTAHCATPHLATPACDHHAREDDAHNESSLVEATDILIQDTTFGLEALYKRKPLTNTFGILALGP